LHNSTLTIELFNKLIEKNLDLTICSDNNMSILHHVCSTMCNIKWIKIFLAHGADPLIRTSNNKTILNLICGNRNVSIEEIKFLLLFIGADHYSLYKLYRINKLSIFEYLLNYINNKDIDKLLELIELDTRSYHNMKDVYIKLIREMIQISIKYK
jgi:ankyrin repeat protein